MPVANRIFGDGTMEVRVDGVPQRRRYEINLSGPPGRGLPQHEPETREGELVMRYVDGSCEIVTLRKER